MKFHGLLHAGAAAIALLASTIMPAHAQPKDAVVRIIVPWPAGNPTDTAARQLGEALHTVTGRNYIVENRTGAAGTIGAAEVARGKPDGTILMMTTGGHTTNATFYPKLPFDTERDFTAITTVSMSSGFAMVVGVNSPYKTLNELIAAAKAKPGTMSYASSGVGNTTHVVAAVFERNAGLKLVHVPYKNSPLTDLRSGQVAFYFLGATAAANWAKDGLVRVLTVTGSKRVPELPDVPALDELGSFSVDVPAWTGVFAPGGMSPQLAQQINREFADAMKVPTFVAQSKNLQRSVVPMPQPEFASMVQAEIQRWKKDLPALGITQE